MKVWDWMPWIGEDAMLLLWKGDGGSVSACASTCTRLVLSRSLWLFDEGSLEASNHDYIYLLKEACLPIHNK